MMSIKRRGYAHWSGNTFEGKGTISTASGALEQYPYGFQSRFEGTPGTNPEELLAAAHAGCFTMAMTVVLNDAQLVAKSLRTTAEVTLVNEDHGYRISASHLILEAEVEDIDPLTFDYLAGKAKENCPLSKVLNAEITLDTRLIE
jgi:lipoyl-dependent peroxiredoxin